MLLCSHTASPHFQGKPEFPLLTPRASPGVALVCSSLLPPATVLAPWSQPCLGGAPLAFNSDLQAIFLGKNLSLISDGVDLVCRISPFFICGNGKRHSRIFHNSARVLFFYFYFQATGCNDCSHSCFHTGSQGCCPHPHQQRDTHPNTQSLSPKSHPSSPATSRQGSKEGAVRAVAPQR